MLVLSILIAAAVTAAPDPSLNALRAIYLVSLQEILSSPEEALRQSTYEAALRKAIEAARKRGDLDGAIALKREDDRFALEKTVPDPWAEDLHQDVDALRTSYREWLGRQEADRDQRVMALSQQYVGRLETLKAALTRENKIDEAMAVHAEIQRVWDSPSVKIAQAGIAARAGTGNETQVTDTPPSAGSEPAGRTSVSRGRKVDIKGGFSGGPTLTAVRIEPGDAVSVKAAGIWQCAGERGSCGPEGYETPPGYWESRKVIQGLRYGALMVRIGNGGAWREVGQLLEFTSDERGVLQFDVNLRPDQALRRNSSGSMTVDIEVKRP